jgi:hypothetical protein
MATDEIITMSPTFDAARPEVRQRHTRQMMRTERMGGDHADHLVGSVPAARPFDAMPCCTPAGRGRRVGDHTITISAQAVASSTDAS